MLNASLMMLVLGAALGLLLAIAGKFLYVEVDTRVEQITGMLPGYNCGACGYAGCAGLAEALVNGEAKSPTQCKPSTEAHRSRITAFMETGVDPVESAHAH
ncbi:MAG TPA: (Fe-S)-binding protein [Erysipelotrichaceae bacterium]|jgi:electron transport complex protein RnfB|nr:(Fe-S)-binding protein [Erysipelotrichaceae bacterium]